MSTLRNPIGPEDKRVYLRRRLLVLGGLLAVLVAIALVILKPGSSGGASSAEKIELPSDVVEQVKPPTDGKVADAPPECAAGNLLVEAVTNQSSYGPGELPDLSLLVSNRGDAECTADLGTAGMRFDISSGAEEYWNSVDCQTNAVSLPVILKPGETLESEPISWDRTRSAPDTCEVERDPVPGEGASYHLFVEAGGVRSASSAQFILH